MTHELFCIIHFHHDDACDERIAQAVFEALQSCVSDELHYAVADDVLIIWRVRKPRVGFIGGE